MARPKPSHLKVVSGTERASRVNHDEPQPATLAKLRPPAHLTGDARAAWLSFAKRLDRMGVLTEADTDALERLAQCLAEVRALDRVLDAEGLTYQTPALDARGRPALDDDGKPALGMLRMRPEVSARADADRRVKAWLVEFGMTPAARSKVKSVDPAAAADPAAKYFG